MTSWLALVPFVVMFTCFALLKMNLLHSSFVALLTCTLFSQTVFHATPETWQQSLSLTGVFMFEIGLILIGAFFFIEVAKRTQILDSLASLVKEITDHRIAQAWIVTYPLEFMIEGSSGFGTPILMVAPLLRALGYPLILCATLPFVGMISAIPFGALGTPLRLGFNGPVQELSRQSAGLVILLLPITLCLTAFLVYFFDPLCKTQIHEKKLSLHRLALWAFTFILVYGGTQWALSFGGPEFPALGGALVAFVWTILTRKFFFGSRPVCSFWGIQVYGALLLVFWIGKQIWLDEKIPGTSLRWFNPGWVFFIFSIALIGMKKLRAIEIIEHALFRSRRTLFVLFCMNWMVQQLQATGAIRALSTALPHFLLSYGVPVTGWIGSILIGTSTVANLFLSPLLDASDYPWLAVGSAVGVQLAFQSVSGVRSILQDAIPEQQIFKVLSPISVGLVLYLMALKCMLQC